MSDEYGFMILTVAGININHILEFEDRRQATSAPKHEIPIIKKRLSDGPYDKKVFEIKTIHSPEALKLIHESRPINMDKDNKNEERNCKHKCFNRNTCKHQCCKSTNSLSTKRKIKDQDEIITLGEEDAFFDLPDMNSLLKNDDLLNFNKNETDAHSLGDFKTPVIGKQESEPGHVKPTITSNSTKKEDVLKSDIEVKYKAKAAGERREQLSNWIQSFKIRNKENPPKAESRIVQNSVVESSEAKENIRAFYDNISKFL